MKLTKKPVRLFALALCLSMALSFALPAMAASIVGYTTINADNTPAYGDSAGTTVIGTFKAKDIVAVEGQVTASGMWVVRQNGTTTAIAYVKKAATAHTGSSVGNKKASDAVATMSGSTAGVDTGSTGSTGGTSTGGQAGYITNCKSNVNFRSAPNSSSSKSSISKNAIITVYELTNGFYKVTNASGQTGYVAKQYVAIGTPSSSSSSSSSSGSGTGTVSNCKSSVNWRATASTSGKKLGTLKKGAKVTVLGTEGDFYKISYNSKTGYIAKQYLTVGSGGGGSSSAGGNVQYDKVRVEPEKSQPSSTIKSGYNAARATNKDTIGYMSIAGTNIKHPILYRSNDPQATYYDSHDANGNSAAKGAVHSFYGVRTRNNTVTAHNQRGSNDMFHQLSHVYDKAAGQSTCQTTDYKCAAASLSSIPDVRTTGSARQWDIYAFGYTKWEVWAMYKTEANEPTSTINYNISFLSTASEAEINTWINTQKSRSLITGSAAANDIFMTLYTCGTNFDNANAQSRIYIFLKAIA